MLRPSDAHLWVACPLAGQLLASGDYPATHDPANTERDVSDSRREGTCAHWVADMVLQGHGPASELIGEVHPNGWVVDQDMADHVTGYVDYVCSFGVPTASEMPVRLFDLISGRLDTVSSGGHDVVRVFDFKYGWRLAEADQNWAMLCYGLAVADGYPMRALELHIFQPRPHHPDGPARVWRIPENDFGMWSNWLRDKAGDCFVYPTGRPGSQCRDCPARGSCHALAANVSAMYEIITDDRTADHTAAELGAYLAFLERASDLLAAKLSGIQAETTARINQGTTVPGWALEPRKGNRRFIVPPDRVKLATGIEPVKSVPMSPAELERAGAPKHVVNLISERPTIGRKLTNNPTAMADRMFGKPEKTI